MNHISVLPSDSITYEPQFHLVFNDDPQCYGLHDNTVITEGKCDMPSYCGIMEQIVLADGFWEKQTFCFPKYNKIAKHAATVYKAKLDANTADILEYTHHIIELNTNPPRYKVLGGGVHQFYPRTSTMAGVATITPTIDQKLGCSYRVPHTVPMQLVSRWYKTREAALRSVPIWTVWYAYTNISHTYESTVQIGTLTHHAHMKSNTQTVCFTRSTYDQNNYCVPMAHTQGHIIGYSQMTAIVKSVFQYVLYLLSEVLHYCLENVQNLIAIVNDQYMLFEYVIAALAVQFYLHDLWFTGMLLLVSAYVIGIERN